MEKDCEHIAPHDDGFTARLRFYQSWYRKHVLGASARAKPECQGRVIRQHAASQGRLDWQ